jgi:hypothetical protein
MARIARYKGYRAAHGATIAMDVRLFQWKQQTDMRLIEGLVRTRLQGKAIFSMPLRQTIKKLEPAGISVPDGLN